MKRLFKSGLPVFLLCILFPFFFSACGQAKYGAGGMGEYAVRQEAAAAAPAAAYDAPALFEADAEAGILEPSLAETNTAQTRKLIKRAELRFRVEDPRATEKPLAELMKKYGAWPASSGVYENSRSYSIRVPSPAYDAMLEEMAGLGKLLGRTENAEDVTLRYYDLEGRLATRQELLKTYQSYLGRAANIEEIMTVESRITDLQYEIDRTGTEFRNLANLVDYSTIDVEILGPVSASSYAKPTLGEKLKELFGSFGDVVSGALVVITGIIIYGVPAVLAAILLFSVFFGRVGLLKKVWRFAAGKKSGANGKKPGGALTRGEKKKSADGALSRDEIDLLLAGSNPANAGQQAPGDRPGEVLTRDEINRLLRYITKGENPGPESPGDKPPPGSTD